MARHRIDTPLDWLASPAVAPIAYFVGTDEWVYDLLLHTYREKIGITDVEYGLTVLHADELSAEQVIDCFQSDSFLYPGPKLIVLRGVPSAKQERLRKTLEQAIGRMGDNTSFVWMLDVYDGAKRPKTYPYTTTVNPSLIIRFDERDDDEMERWTRYLLQQSSLKLSNKGVQQLAASAQFPYELNSVVEQLKVWSQPDGSINDDVLQRLALGEMNSVIEEVAYYLVCGEKEKMVAALYRLNEQEVAKNATSILWRLGTLLHETWFWITPAKGDEEFRWSPAQSFIQQLESRRKKVPEEPLWNALADLAELDSALKRTGSFRQEHRLLVQTLLPAVNRFVAGTNRKVSA